MSWIKEDSHDPNMSEADILNLRKAGLTEEKILSVVLITSMFSFINRIDSGLGVEITENKQDLLNSWLEVPVENPSWLANAGATPNS